jgi:hypothetical protein
VGEEMVLWVVVIWVGGGCFFGLLSPASYGLGVRMISVLLSRYVRDIVREREKEIKVGATKSKRSKKNLERKKEGVWDRRGVKSFTAFLCVVR